MNVGTPKKGTISKLIMSVIFTLKTLYNTSINGSVKALH